MKHFVTVLMTLLVAGSLCGCSEAATETPVESVSTDEREAWLPLDESLSGSLEGISVTTVDARVGGPPTMGDWIESSRPDMGHITVLVHDRVSGIPYERSVVMYYDKDTDFHLIGPEPGETTETTADILATWSSSNSANVEYHVENDTVLFIDRIGLGYPTH